MYEVRLVPMAITIKEKLENPTSVVGMTNEQVHLFIINLSVEITCLLFLNANCNITLKDRCTKELGEEFLLNW